MTLQPAGHQRIALKFTLVTGAGLALILMFVCAALGFATYRLTKDRALVSIADKTTSVADTVQAFDSTTRVLVDKFYRPFREGFRCDFAPNAAGDDLNCGQVGLANRFDEVDAFHASTGGVATVFLRAGEDFRRITTSLKKENGERAMGTMLDHQHPAWRRALEGQSYTGRATLFGKPYMTFYDPLKDASGQVVGILFIGFDLTAFDTSVRTVVSEAKFLDSGGMYVIDPRKSAQEAVFVVHPQASGRKVLEVYPEAASTLAALKSGELVERDGSAAMLTGKAGTQWLLMRPVKNHPWWIVAHVPAQEVIDDVWRLMVLIAGVLALSGLVLTGMVIWVLTRWVVRPLKGLGQAVGMLAEGDLTQRFESAQRDEIGDLVRQVEAMRLRMQEALGTVQQAVESVDTASREIATGNQDLSGRTEQTASSLQEAASSMEHLDGTVRHTAEAALGANDLAGQAAQAAARGGEVVGQVVHSMEAISQSSRRISEIIGVIDGIAFQTNILALNAAVEAARAGEQGRGFAVVASEVRTLAQRSAQAAKEIKGLITDSTERVAEGSALVHNAGRSMQEIVAGVERVSRIIGDITAAASEQSGELGRVNQAVTQLDQMTQQNAALVEQSAAAAESLRDQARRLAVAVSAFRLAEGALSD